MPVAVTKVNERKERAFFLYFKNAEFKFSPRDFDPNSENG